MKIEDILNLSDGQPSSRLHPKLESTSMSGLNSN